MKDYPNLDTKAATANQAMDTILALTEKLQRAEARALAAEKVISDAQTHWNITVGKTLDYSPMSKILQSIDLTAARDVLRKAEEWDKIADNLRAALQESQAMLLKVETALRRWRAGGSNDSVLLEIERGLSPAAATALADLKARIKREVLEEAAKHLHNCEMDVEAITELRRMAGVPNA